MIPAVLADLKKEMSEFAATLVQENVAPDALVAPSRLDQRLAQIEARLDRLEAVVVNGLSAAPLGGGAAVAPPPLPALAAAPPPATGAASSRQHSRTRIREKMKQAGFLKQAEATPPVRASPRGRLWSEPLGLRTEPVRPESSFRVEPMPSLPKLEDATTFQDKVAVLKQIVLQSKSGASH